MPPKLMASYYVSLLIMIIVHGTKLLISLTIINVHKEDSRKDNSHYSALQVGTLGHEALHTPYCHYTVVIIVVYEDNRCLLSHFKLQPSLSSQPTCNCKALYAIYSYTPFSMPQMDYLNRHPVPMNHPLLIYFNLASFPGLPLYPPYLHIRIIIWRVERKAWERGNFN